MKVIETNYCLFIGTWSHSVEDKTNLFANQLSTTFHPNSPLNDFVLGDTVEKG